METKETINKDDFIQWKKNPVTLKVFAAIETLRDNINSAMSSDEVILGDNSEKNMVRLLGQREGLNVLLNVHEAEVIDED